MSVKKLLLNVEYTECYWLGLNLEISNLHFDNLTFTSESLSLLEMMFKSQQQIYFKGNNAANVTFSVKIILLYVNRKFQRHSIFIHIARLSSLPTQTFS